MTCDKAKALAIHAVHATATTTTTHRVRGVPPIKWVTIFLFATASFKVSSHYTVDNRFITRSTHRLDSVPVSVAAIALQREKVPM